MSNEAPIKMTPFSTLLSGRTVDESTVSFQITGDWLQGRTSFGGLISTLAVQAMRDVAGPQWPANVRLLALQTSFIGPVGMGPVEVIVKLLREGKNVRQVQATVRQQGQTAALLLGVFGADRETVVPVISPPQPATISHEQLPDVPERPGAPQFLVHLDLRFAEGKAPFSRQPSTTSRIYIRLRNEPVEIDLELLTVLLADVPPTPMLSAFDKQTPASSVSWELEPRRLSAKPPADGWWRVDTEILAAAGGYINQVTRLWAPAGELAALGYQVVTVFG